ncbi:homocysteine S-methyltransferase family protein [Maricaulis maris]|uniref:homocysteine S-methyltransferase family protein n=1 Tax=Maricaulis maris TaxID=74318 RepID=UPI003B8B655A
MTPAPSRSPARPVLTDGGLETWLIFDRGVELPDFAAFPLLDTADGRRLLTEYWDLNLTVATTQGLDFILGAPTWRASADWGVRLGYDAASLDRINRDAIAFMQALRDRHQTASISLPVWGSVGPRGDAYNPDRPTGASEAEAYHRPQIESFKAAGADAFTAQTLTHSDEAIGIARAARAAGLPCTLSFTTETDGRLPGGEALGDAIQRVDGATDAAPDSYMINCAHPDHFRQALACGEPWLQRLGGVRANASRLSHAELDNATELKSGDPVELGALYRQLRETVPGLTVLGGCCGTDHRHIEQICKACV